MKKIIYLLFFALVLMQFSCKKETLPLNETEQTVENLRRLIESERVQRVIPFESAEANFSNTVIVGDYGKFFKLENPFLILGNKAWNLKNLRKYDLQFVNNVQSLGLYFY